MATIFTHPLIPVAIVLALGRMGGSPRLLVYACLASILPDIDVIAFNFGINKLIVVTEESYDKERMLKMATHKAAHLIHEMEVFGDAADAAAPFQFID